MAKIYERKEFIQVYEAVDKTCCDICGASCEGTKWPHVVHGWGDAPAEAQVTVSFQWKTAPDEYGGSSVGLLIDIDLCPTCFTNKLVPWVSDQNPEFKAIEEHLDG